MCSAVCHDPKLNQAAAIHWVPAPQMLRLAVSSRKLLKCQRIFCLASPRKPEISATTARGPHGKRKEHDRNLKTRRFRSCTSFFLSSILPLRFSQPCLLALTVCSLLFGFAFQTAAPNQNIIFNWPSWEFYFQDMPP